MSIDDLDTMAFAPGADELDTAVTLSDDSPSWVEEFGTSGADYVSAAAKAQEVGAFLQVAIMQKMADAQNNSARSQQSASRVLGMSELGGCREFIRATVAGDVKTPEQGLKWAAFVGTATGDYMEGVLKTDDERVITQRRLTLELKNGIRISGSGDAIFPPEMDGLWADAVLDFKTKDGLGTVRREGPTFKEKCQISGYLIAAVQEGLLTNDASAHLFYIDRSGKSKEAHVWSVSVAQAYAILDAAEERLDSVANALATAQHATRDEPETWCRAIKCPFYATCWAGYMPTDIIDDPRRLGALEIFIEARDDTKVNKDLMDAAKIELRGDPTTDVADASGVTPDGTIIRWTLVAGKSGQYEKLEVRVPE